DCFSSGLSPKKTKKYSPPPCFGNSRSWRHFYYLFTAIYGMILPLCWGKHSLILFTSETCNCRGNGNNCTVISGGLCLCFPFWWLFIRFTPAHSNLNISLKTKPFPSGCWPWEQWRKSLLPSGLFTNGFIPKGKKNPHCLWVFGC